MDIGIGTCFSTRKYEYTITERDNLGFFIASVKIRGQLGKIDTGVTVRIVMENESSGIDMNALMRSAALFEAFRMNNVLCCAMKDDADTVEASVVDDDPKVANGANGGSKAYYEEPSATANDEEPSNSTNDLKPDADGFVYFGKHRYRGQMSDGNPDGKGMYISPDGTVWDGFWINGKPTKRGTIKWKNGQVYDGEWNSYGPNGEGKMMYPDKRVYTGTFRNGERHGQGTLTMPNGESFKGEFVDDKISENGTYYDRKGRPRKVKPKDISKNGGGQGFLACMWKKTWRLWAALFCFLMIPVVIWMLLEFFSGNGGTHIRVGAILAPFYLFYHGIKFLIGSVNDLFGDNQKE